MLLNYLFLKKKAIYIIATLTSLLLFIQPIIFANTTLSSPESMPTDIELQATSNATIGIYKNISFDVTITNSSEVEATDIVVDIPYIMGATLQGGNEFSTTAGIVSTWPTVTWRLSSLSPKSSETITLNYFTLTADPVQLYAQVTAMAQDDMDSTPNNGTPPKPHEDDEAAFTIGDSATPLTDLTVSNLNINFPTNLVVGEVYNYTFDLNNISGILAAGDFRIGTYLSTNPTFDASDILVGEISTGNILANTTMVNGAIQVTNEVSSDDYYLIVVVDDLQNIEESNENNNTIVSAMTFGVNNDNTNVCSGNFTATTQAELDAFPADCTTWNGSIFISGNDINDLSPLSNLVSVHEGSLTIENTSVITATGGELANLKNVEGTLIIQQNSLLKRLDLSGLEQVSGLGFYFNEELFRISFPDSLSVDSWLQLISNAKLRNIFPFPNIINNDISDITIANNEALYLLGGPFLINGSFPNLNITITENNSLFSLQGLENIERLNQLTITNNPNLQRCCFINDLITDVGYNTLNISGNDTGCNSDNEIVFNCNLLGESVYSLSIIDVQCQNNNTLDDPSDDTYEATIEVVINENYNSPFGSFLVNGVSAGDFNAPNLDIQLYQTGTIPIAQGDTTLTFTNVNGSFPSTITIEAPATCSNGSNPDECGFVALQDNLPTGFLDATSFSNPLADIDNGITENQDGYLFTSSDNGITALQTNFEGEEIALILSDVNTFKQTATSNTELEISYQSGASNIWTNTFIFDSGDLQGDPFYTSTLAVDDGYVFLVKVFGVTPTGWILKTDLNGNQVYKEVLYAGLGDNTFGFANIALNGDFLVYRHNESRQAELLRIDATNGNLIYQTQIVGDLVTSKMGGFRETLDGQFIYASFRDQLINKVKKLNAFTGEVVWEVTPNFVIDDVDFPFNNGQTNVAVTQDGGFVISYRSIENAGANGIGRYARFNANGSLVWERQFPDNYNLEAQFPTSDGGFILTGTIEGEPAIVKITSQGSLTPNCGGDDGGGNTGSDGTDVEFTLETTNPITPAFTLKTVTATITNTGTEPATGISVSLPLPFNAVFEGGNEYTATQGVYTIYDIGNQLWNVGDLAAGTSAEMSINYFVLGGPNEVIIYGQVETLNETDIDSTPNNGVSSNINEDDEAILSLPKSANTFTADNGLFSQVNQNNDPISLEILKAFPNPTTDQLTLNIGSATNDLSQYRVINLQGQVLQTGNFNTVQGINQLQLNVSDLSKGIYFVSITQADHQTMTRFIKQ